jgi:hypothetical protein
MGTMSIECWRWRGGVGIGLADHDEYAAVGVQGVADPPLAPVDDVLVPVALDPGRDVRRVGGGDVRLGHGEGRADLAVEQRAQPTSLVLLGAEAAQHLHVAGVGSAAVHRLGRHVQAPAGDFRQRGVLGVGQPGALVGIRVEEIPQAARPRRLLELLEDRWMEVRPAGGAHLLLVDPFGRVDALVHEGVQALLEVLAALGQLEVHAASIALLVHDVNFEL